MSSSAVAATPIRTMIPARLNRLGWVGVVEALIGIDAEGKSLEVTKPLTSATPTAAASAAAG